MRPEFESLKSEAERLPEGADKKAMLEMLEQAAQLDEQANREIEGYQLKQKRTRLSEIVFGLLLSCATGYFFVVGILTGRVPNIFIRNTPYEYWEHDPYVFLFILVFFGLLTAAFLCIALGVIQFRKKTQPAVRSTVELERRIKEQSESLAKANYEWPQVKFFGMKRRSLRVPAWLAILVIVLFVGFLIYSVARGS